MAVEQLTYTEFMTDVAEFLGYSPDSADWSTQQETKIQNIVRRGINKFYRDHDWNFLRPRDSITIWPDVAEDVSVIVDGLYDGSSETTLTASEATFYQSMEGATITISSSDYTITDYLGATKVVVSGDAGCVGEQFSIASGDTFRLPDNYGGIVGRFTFEPYEGYNDVDIVGEGQIRSLHQHSYTTGRPKKAAIVPTEATGASQQRYDTIFYPNPGSVYVLTYKKMLLAPTINESNPYPLGGAFHCETQREACLMMAEHEMNDEADIHTALYQQELKSSIKHDTSSNAGNSVGVNLDRHRGDGARRRSNHLATHEGRYTEA